ncbi:MAG: hypothetical protein M0P91_11780 [Sulfuricurvum sp.]|jgi:DNA mismatch repair protein MutS|uniref:MutS-related protein n=1 Tax=Sulfuricurvum sp. TaxID=2025608 RepID=UPI0025FAF549|nr:hypothetical protein [Sulfuricurvum sp.]MCK9373867.1 hypothetical protein [Sulfuricurvum sp.]
MNSYSFDDFLINGSVGAVYIDKGQNGICIGFAYVERLGMQSWVCEIKSSPFHPYGAVDQVQHLLSIGNVKRLRIGASSKELIAELKNHFEFFDYDVSDGSINCEDQIPLFQETFALNTLLTPHEHLSLESRPLAAQALAMVSVMVRQSPYLPISSPFILDISGLLEIGNNALEQLEITSADPRALSVDALVLKMVTPMGKRLGRLRLHLPIRDVEELERRYNWCEWLSPHDTVIAKMLSVIGDLEEMWLLIENQKGSVETAERCVGSMQEVLNLLAYLTTHKVPIFFTPEEEILPCCNGLMVYYQNRRWVKQYVPFVRSLLHFIAQVDVAVSSARVSKHYGLSRPRVIQTRRDDNFLQVMGLRHLLVESQGIAYVANDIVMGKRDYLDLPYPNTVMLDSKVHDGADINGVLLYGINSSGKSSLMKSIGIAVVLAQAGFFVPAASMTFSLFDGLYTRILSRDNVAKSLSTFGVEMLELNTIFHRITPKTLVLGDEISHGTETLSAVAIVAATVMELASKGVLFLMTTHLHQLSMVQELTGLRHVVSLHLSVRYDENSDSLLYDRILRAGRGSSVYGLEFAESLHMHPAFLKNAKRLRENLAKEYTLLELGHKKEHMKRYRDVVVCECIICGALVRVDQKKGAEREHHHLIPLCGRHHRMMAEGKIKVRGFIMTPQGLRMEYEMQLQG